MKKYLLVVLFALGTIAVFSQSETSKLRIMHAQDESRLFYVNDIKPLFIITATRTEYNTAYKNKVVDNATQQKCIIDLNPYGINCKFDLQFVYLQTPLVKVKEISLSCVEGRCYDAYFCLYADGNEFVYDKAINCFRIVLAVTKDKINPKFIEVLVPC